MSFIPVILGGGSGSRLWPLSRELFPKPFIPLPDGETLIRKTYERAIRLPDVSHVMTVIGRDMMFMAADEYELASDLAIRHSFILEPFGRNTAAAVALACLCVEEEEGDDATVLIMPSDHIVNGDADFHSAISSARYLAELGKIVTFGIRPDRPEPGFGYIEGFGNSVLRFIEKPTAETAKGYLQSGNFFWNSGMLCFCVQTMLDALNLHCPDLLLSVKAAFMAARKSNNGQRSVAEIDRDKFSSVPAISIDYAVMEKHIGAGFVPCSFAWSDVGSFSRFSELFDADADGNRMVGNVVAHKTKNSFIHGEERVIGLAGVKDLLVVDTADAILIADKSHANDVRYIHDRLSVQQEQIVLSHQTSRRPWGNFKVLEEGENYKIKRIEVRPQAWLSLQSHRRRSEHWVVVRGSAVIMVEGKETVLHANQSVNIPVGTLHRLGNMSKETLIVIEIQSGPYLGEDDIMRFDDIYGRADA